MARRAASPTSSTSPRQTPSIAATVCCFERLPTDAPLVTQSTPSNKIAYRPIATHYTGKFDFIAFKLHLYLRGLQMAAEREKFYECEVKRRRVRAAGGYESFWKVKPIAVAIEDEDTEFRCMKCNGAVKVFKRRSEDGLATHIEHKL